MANAKAKYEEKEYRVDEGEMGLKQFLKEKWDWSIVTHAGLAHFDEMLAIALILSAKDEFYKIPQGMGDNASIERIDIRNWSPPKWEPSMAKGYIEWRVDRKPLVLDQGGKCGDYEDAFYIDHHYNGAEHCTAYQIAEILFPELLEFPITKANLDRIDLMDRKGPRALDFDPQGVLWAEFWMADEFGRTGYIPEGLIEMIKYWVDQAREYKKVKLEVEQLGKSWIGWSDFPDEHQYNVLHHNYIGNRLAEMAINERCKREGIAIIVCPGRVGQKAMITPAFQSILKFNPNCPRNEFQKLSDDEIVFLHQDGWLIETKEPDQWNRAITGRL